MTTDPKIIAKVSYMFFVPMKDTDRALDVLSSMPGAITKADESPVMCDIVTATEFLHGGDLRFPCKRFLFSGYDISVKDCDASDGHVLATVFWDAGICEISVNFTVAASDTESLIYLRQIFLSDTKVCGDRSIKATAGEYFSRMGADIDDAEISYIVELNKFFDDDTADEIFSEDASELYGIMTGDEGYEYVPKELCRTRLGNRWSTRDFAGAVVYRNNFLLANLNRGIRIKRYIDHQTRFGTEYYGGLNPYFAMDCAIAGVNHGIMFSCEVGMVAKSVSSAVLKRQAELSGKYGHLKNDIGTTKQLRRELILTLNRLETVDMAELGDLDRLVMDGLDVNPLVEKIKYLLELLESELDLLYQSSTNRLVNLLTVLGLILAAVQVILPFFQ